MVIYNSTVRGIKRGIINKDERSKILIIPEGVKSIGTNAFIDNTDIEEVVLPESLISIEDCAFSGCTGLKKIKFPQGLKKIGPFSFFGCESLEDIVFPDSLEYLIGGSFAGCVNLKKVDFLLDWVPNTNHTGLYVAKEKGYFTEEGIDLDIKQPANESTSDLVINNKAPMGVYFQDYMASKLAKGAPITAVAAIIENNTSGIITNKKLNINSPKELAGHKYGTWDIPIELNMLQFIMEKDGGDFSKVELVPNTDDNSITPLSNGVFDAAPVYYAWDKIMGDSLGIETNFFYYKDYAPELNFYSPVIIANNDYLKDNKNIPLTAKEYELLQTLYRNAGRIVTIDTLCEAVWGENAYVYTNSLMTHIRRIREKIEINPSHPVSLITMKGLGYKLIVERK